MKKMMQMRKMMRMMEVMEAMKPEMEKDDDKDCGDGKFFNGSKCMSCMEESRYNDDMECDKLDMFGDDVVRRCRKCMRDDMDMDMEKMFEKMMEGKSDDEKREKRMEMGELGDKIDKMMMWSMIKMAAKEKC